MHAVCDAYYNHACVLPGTTSTALAVGVMQALIFGVTTALLRGTSQWPSALELDPPIVGS